MTHDGADSPRELSAPDAGDLRREIASLQERNTRLTATLHEARAKLLAMKDEIDRLKTTIHSVADRLAAREPLERAVAHLPRFPLEPEEAIAACMFACDSSVPYKNFSGPNSSIAPAIHLKPTWMLS